MFSQPPSQSSSDQDVERSILDSWYKNLQADAEKLSDDAQESFLSVLNKWYGLKLRTLDMHEEIDEDESVLEQLESNLRTLEQDMFDRLIESGDTDGIMEDGEEEGGEGGESGAGENDTMEQDSDGMKTDDKEKLPLGDGEGYFISPEDARRMLNASGEVDVNYRIRDFLASEFDTTEKMSVNDVVDAYQITLPHIREGLMIVDTNAKGLGVFASSRIDSGEFIGFFTGEWELTTTVDTVLKNQQRRVEDVSRWTRKNNLYSNKVFAVESYASEFAYKIRVGNGQEVPTSGKSSRIQTHDSSSLTVCPRLIATPEMEDQFSSQLRVFGPPDVPMYDAMALMNHSDEPNVEQVSIFIPNDMKTHLFPMIVCMSKRQIQAGEELLLTYTVKNKPKTHEKKQYMTSLTRGEPKRKRGDYLNYKDHMDNIIDILIRYYKSTSNIPKNAMGPSVDASTFYVQNPEFEYIHDGIALEDFEKSEKMQMYADKWVSDYDETTARTRVSMYINN